MKKFRFLELNNGRVVPQRRFCFFFWVDVYHYAYNDERHSFRNLEEAKHKLERDLKEREDNKVKKIHE